MEERREQIVTTTTTTTPPAASVPVAPVAVAPPAAVTTTEQVETVAVDPLGGLYRVRQIIYLVLGLVEGLLLIRFVLRLLGANPAAGFAQFIYGVTAPLMAPFFGLFGSPRFEGSVLEISTIVAMIVYALLAWLIWKIISLASQPRTSVVTKRMDTRM